MLDDGQPQPCAADFPGMALIHPVEALEHALLFLFGNSNAGIPDLQYNRSDLRCGR